MSMKKCSILLVATSVIMAGCNNSIEVVPEVENEDVTATIEQPDVLTTKGLSYSDGALKFVWEAGDQVMVYGTSTSFIFNVTEGGSDVTKLESPDFTLNDKVTYYTFSPVVGTLSEAKKTALNVSFEGQRQVANSDTKHLRLNQYACATATVENNAVNFQFKNQVSWIVYSVTFPEAVIGAKSVTISASEGTPFVLNGTLDATNAVSEKGLKTSITIGKKASELTLALGEESGNGIDLTAGETLNAFFTIHPVDLTGKTITFTVKDAEGNTLATNNFVGRVINRNACAAFNEKSTKPEDAVSVDGVNYATIKDAIANVSNGGVITVNSDLREGGLFVPAGDKEFTIDLSGHTFISAAPLAGSSGTENQALHLEKGNTITIKNGIIAAADGLENIKFIIQNYSNLTLENVTIDAANLNYPGQVLYAISNNCGNVLLSGNTSIINVPAGAVALDACKYASYEKPLVTFATTGTIGGEIELSGGDIKLDADLNITQPIVGRYKGVSDINLGGKTLTAPKIAVLNEDATLTVHDGNIVSEKHLGVMVGSNTKTDITNCSVSGLEGAVGTGKATGATININGGTYTATDNAVIAGNGSKREGEPNNITIEGGTFKGLIKTTGYIACGIYAPWKDIITVNGGDFEITNGVGVLCRGGKVSINGGSFKTDGTVTGWVGDNKNQIACKTLVLDKAAQYPDYENAEIIVNGGKYSDDACASFLDETHIISVSSNKKIYTVGEIKIGLNGTYYNSLQAAIDASSDGNSLTFYSNVTTTSVTIPAGKHLTFNLNGKTVSVKGNSTGCIILDGDLIIKGSGSFVDVNGDGDLFEVHDATLTVDEGCKAIFQSSLSCVKMSSASAKLVINGGKWKSGEVNAKYLTINKGEEGKNSQIIVKGGAFYKFDPAIPSAENPQDNWVADGYTSYQDGDWYKVITVVEKNTLDVEKNLSVKGASVSENVDVNCITAGANATLLLEKGAVINGYGQVSGSAREVIMSSRGLNIEGSGKIVADIPNDVKQCAALRVGGGVVNIYDGVTLEGGSGNSGNYAIRIISGTVNIYGGYFHSSNTSATKEGASEVIYLESAWAASSKPSLNIHGGVFETDGNASYLINCQDCYKSKCSIKIMGGTFVGFDPANNTADGPNTNYVADGYKSTKTIYNGKDAWVVTKIE